MAMLPVHNPQAVHISSPAIHADLYVGYILEFFVPNTADMTDVRNNMKIEVFSYFLLCMLIAGVLIAAELVIVLRDFSLKRFLQSFRSTVSILTDSLLYQSAYEPVFWPSRWVWWSFTVFTFVAIYGYLLNMVSVDRVATQPPKRLDTIDDLLFEEPFTTKHLKVARSLYYFQYMREADKDSKLGQLFDRLNKTNRGCDSNDLSSCSFVEYKADKYLPLWKMVLNCLRTSSSMLIVLEPYYGHVLRPGFCILFKENAHKLAKSANSFAENVLTWFFNKKLSKQLLTYVDYRTATMLEFGYGHVMQNNFLRTFLDAVPFSAKFDWFTYKCLANVKPDEKVEAIGRSQLRITFILTVVCIAIASLVLIAEFATFYAVKANQKRRKTIKIMPSQKKKSRWIKVKPTVRSAVVINSFGNVVYS